MSSCSRCKGTGYIKMWRHVENGICFKCRGAHSPNPFKQAEPVSTYTGRTKSKSENKVLTEQLTLKEVLMTEQEYEEYQESVFKYGSRVMATCIPVKL